MLREYTKDATFFALVHSVLEAEQQRAASERRNGLRHPYERRQLVAPVRDGELPLPADFRPVQCVDLSAHGLAYLTSDVQVDTHVVVVLGEDRPIWLTAEVVRREPVVVEGGPLFRVACRFSGRIDASDADVEQTLRPAIRANAPN